MKEGRGTSFFVSGKSAASAEAPRKTPGIHRIGRFSWIKNLYPEPIIAPPYTAADIDQRLNDYFPWESACFFQDAAGRSGMMIQSASITCDSLAENARRLQKALAKQLPEPAAIMISDRMTGIESMREIYSQTLEVWKLKYHREKGRALKKSIPSKTRQFLIS